MPAVRYLCLRIGHGLLVLLGVSLLSFLLAAAAPGTFADELRLDPRVSPETIAGAPLSRPRKPHLEACCDHYSIS